MDNFKGYTVTFHVNPNRIVREHNIRNPEYVATQLDHIDPNGYHCVLLDEGDIREVYEKIFSKAIEEYNATQRKDRQINGIDEYIKKITDDSRLANKKQKSEKESRKLQYEALAYIGNKYIHPDPKISEKIITDFIVKVLPKKFKNIIPILVAVHGDEFYIDIKTKEKKPGALHVHFDFCFIAHSLTKEEREDFKKYKAEMKRIKKAEVEAKGEKWDEKLWKKKDWRKICVERYGKALERGMVIESSLSAACNEMGFYTEPKKGLAQTQLEEAIRQEFMNYIELCGLKVDRSKKKHRKHKDVGDYQNDMDQKSLEQEREILEQEKIMLMNEKDDFDRQIESIEEMEVKNNLEKKEIEVQKKNLEEKEAGLAERLQSLEELEQTLLDDKEELKRRREKLENDMVEFNLDAKTEKQKIQDCYEDIKIKQKELEEREAKLLEGEKPYLELMDKIQIKNENLQNQKISLENKLNDLANRNAIIEDREVAVKDLEARSDAVLKAAEEKEKNAKRLKDEIVVENKKMECQLAKWREISENVDDKKINNELEYSVKKYLNNKFENGSFQNLLTSVKDLACGFALKLKNQISDLKKQLFGYNQTIKGRARHVYGANEIAEMFTSASSEDFRKIAADMDDSGSVSFAEHYKKKPRCLERFFEYARKISRNLSREIGVGR